VARVLTSGCRARFNNRLQEATHVRIALLISSLLLATDLLAQAGSPALDEPRPIEAVDTVFIEDLTWMEVRDAIQAGKSTVLVASGGVEQNGPYLVTGKHNVVLQAMTESIARKLGNALVAPIIAFVPEGDFDPPTGHMRYPGTISLTQETYKALLRDIASSLKAHGFEHVIFIGDSGGNQTGMKEVASELTVRFRGKPGVHFIPEFYDYDGLMAWLKEQGYPQVDQGLHDDYGITSIMMSVEPESVRYRQRVLKGLDSINGIRITPIEKTQEVGRKAVEWRAEQTVEAIRKAVSSHPASSP
jgi:creatinine amidohydrolase/Fe(II)-dependent formamide hydrolase-like protein